MRYIARIIARNDFLLAKLKSLWIQTTLFASSQLQITSSYEIANGRVDTSKNTKSRDILEILKFLRAKNISGGNLVRIGPYGEGGYIILDMLAKLNTVISIGIGKDTSFEEDMNSKLNHTSIFHLFDHTDVPLRQLPKNFNFYSKGIASETNEELNLLSLENIVDMCLNEKSIPLLKIDVDGAEYEALSKISRKSFSRFEQIVIEFHDLKGENTLNGKFHEILKTLNEDFFVIHLHPNNFEPWIVINGFSLPNVLEVTFLNRKYLKLTDKQLVVFPRNLDAPNNLETEMILGAFYFPDPE